VMLHSIDDEGRLVSVSDYWLASLGYERDEVVGRASTDFLTDESRRYAVDVVIPAFRESGACRDIEYQFVKKNGEVIDVLLSAIAERDAAGAMVRSLAVLVDITARKQAEEAVIKAREEAEALAAIARDLASSLDQQEVLNRIVSHARVLTDSDLSNIAVRQPGTALYTFVAESGARGRGWIGLTTGEGTSLGGLALAANAPLATLDYNNDPRIGSEFRSVAEEEGTSSAAAAPARVGDETVALLYVSNRGGRPYREADLRLAAGGSGGGGASECLALFGAGRGEARAGRPAQPSANAHSRQPAHLLFAGPGSGA
jgi:PAS domain S-box-containing protein